MSVIKNNGIIYRVNDKSSKNFGFTLIELLIFVVAFGILASTLLMSYNAVLRGSSSATQIAVASQAAEQCMSWYIGQRKLYGYGSIVSPSIAVPNFCVAPAGYGITASVSNTTISPDTTSNYKTIVVGVSYGGVQQASASLLIANY